MFYSTLYRITLQVIDCLLVKEYMDILIGMLQQYVGADGQKCKYQQHSTSYNDIQILNALFANVLMLQKANVSSCFRN